MRNAPLLAVLIGCLMVVGISHVWKPRKVTTLDEMDILTPEPIQPYSQTSESLYNFDKQKVEFRLAKEKKPRRYARKPLVKRTVSSVR